jgi:hypothetical protein
MVEHTRQQRLIVECCNHNNGMDPLIGTIVVASAPEVDDGMSTGMSTRGAKRQRHIEHEQDDNQSNITFEGIDVIDDFGPIIPSPSSDADPMEAELHSRGSISVVHYIAYLGMEKGGVTLSIRRSTSVSQTNGIMWHECCRISIIHCILVTTMCHKWKSAA